MCDEARSHKEEQLTICVRYTKHMKIQERFLTFVVCSTTRNANGISNIILENLKTLNIDKVLMISQSYDGASVMAGHINGVQTKIREVYPEATYFHCVAHKLNLVIIGMCKNVKSSTQFFNTLESLYIHFSRPSSHNRLINIQKKLGIKPREITQISDTRWACRFESCDMVKQHYGVILEVLDAEVDEGNDFNCIEAEGILNCLKKGNFVINLFVFHEILKYINILSKNLQSKGMTLGKALNMIKSIKKNYGRKTK